jgi:hypothetical protein
MEIVPAYVDDDGKPILAESYCFFLDFLGFSSYVQSAKSLDEEQKLLDKFVRDVSPHIEEASKPKAFDYDTVGKRFWGAKIFTDNLVLGYPIKSKAKEAELGNAVFDAMYYQLNCVLSGFFVRGGMTYGNLCIADDIVFGKALINAVEVEKSADFPRIAICDSMKDLIHGHMAFYGSPEDSTHHKTFLSDNSQVWFLNYLMWLAEDEFIDRSNLDKHKKVICLCLDRFREHDKIFRKYRWVAEYHNWFCKNYYDEDGDVEGFFIPGIQDDYGIRQLNANELLS